MSAPILAVRGLSRRYGNLLAVNDVTFAVMPGEIVSLIGPNGAGKSTVFNLLTGYVPPTAGEIEFQGMRIEGRTTVAIARLGIARAFQIARPFRGLSVRDNVRVGALYGRSGPRDVDGAIAAALDAAGLVELADRNAADLTIGQLRKLELARAFAARPDLLLADEPLAGLVPAESDEVLHSLQRLRAGGMTVLLVEHDMKAVMKVSDRVVVLDAGQKIADGPPAAVANDPKVIEAYLGQEEPA